MTHKPQQATANSHPIAVQSSLVNTKGRLLIMAEHRSQSSLRGSFERALRHHQFDAIDVSAYQLGSITVVLDYDGYRVHRWDSPRPWFLGAYGNGANHVAKALTWAAEINH